MSVCLSTVGLVLFTLMLDFVTDVVEDGLPGFVLKVNWECTQELFLSPHNAFYNLRTVDL